MLEWLASTANFIGFIITIETCPWMLPERLSEVGRPILYVGGHLPG